MPQAEVHTDKKLMNSKQPMEYVLVNTSPNKGQEEVASLSPSRFTNYIQNMDQTVIRNPYVVRRSPRELTVVSEAETSMEKSNNTFFNKKSRMSHMDMKQILANSTLNSLNSQIKTNEWVNENTMNTDKKPKVIGNPFEDIANHTQNSPQIKKSENVLQMTSDFLDNCIKLNEIADSEDDMAKDLSQSN